MGKNSKMPPGTWIERDLFDSKAYHSLRGWAPQLLTIFLSKRQFQTIGRNGKQKKSLINGDNITMTAIEAKKRFGITQPRFTRAIDELLAKGFITLIHQGGAYQQDKSIYGLSDKWIMWKNKTVCEYRPKEKIKRGFQLKK